MSYVGRENGPTTPRMPRHPSAVYMQQITGNACVGVMQVGRQAEGEVQRRIKDAGERYKHQVAMQHKLELARAIGDLTV